MTIHEIRSANPLDVLLDEHRAILAVLAALDHAASRLEHGSVFDRGFWQRGVGFFADFADREHMGKEEGALFPILVERGLAAHRGPIGVLTHEHIEWRALRDRMDRAVELGRPGELCAACHAFVQLLREHIGKEERVLYPMARDLLSGEDLARMRVEFAQLTHEFGGAGRSVTPAEMARALCAEAGLDVGRLFR